MEANITHQLQTEAEGKWRACYAAMTAAGVWFLGFAASLAISSWFAPSLMVGIMLLVSIVMMLMTGILAVGALLDASFASRRETAAAKARSTAEVAG